MQFAIEKYDIPALAANLTAKELTDDAH